MKILNQEMNMLKLASLFRSRRFWIAQGTVIALMVNAQFGVDEATTMAAFDKILAVAAEIGWIIGDAIRKTE